MTFVVICFKVLVAVVSDLFLLPAIPVPSTWNSSVHLSLPHWNWCPWGQGPHRALVTEEATVLGTEQE